jgi:hypothetical protein
MAVVEDVKGEARWLLELKGRLHRYSLCSGSKTYPLIFILLAIRLMIFGSDRSKGGACPMDMDDDRGSMDVQNDFHIIGA